MGTAMGLKNAGWAEMLRFPLFRLNLPDLRMQRPAPRLYTGRERPPKPRIESLRPVRASP